MRLVETREIEPRTHMFYFERETFKQICYNNFMTKEYILDYLGSVKEKYQDEGFYIKALFGSYARNEANANSDVDILVD